MLSALQLNGTLVATITPMRDRDGEQVLDLGAFRKQLRRIAHSGCAGVVVGGTTGQSCVLDADELAALAGEACGAGRAEARALGRGFLVLAAAGSNCTRSAVAKTRELARRVPDIDGFLHVTGYYNNPPQAGLRRHFEAVADAAAEHGKGVVLYNVPSRTNSNIAAETAIALAKHPAVAGLKEASGDLAQVRAIAEATDRGAFALLSGEDHLVAAVMALGGSGVISASANMWPAEFQALTELAAAGRWAEAEALQEALLPCVRAVFSAKNPIPLHEMMGSRLRLPLVEVSELDEASRARVRFHIGEALAIQRFPGVARTSAEVRAALAESGEVELPELRALAV